MTDSTVLKTGLQVFCQTNPCDWRSSMLAYVVLNSRRIVARREVAITIFLRGATKDKKPSCC